MRSGAARGGAAAGRGRGRGRSGSGAGRAAGAGAGSSRAGTSGSSRGTTGARPTGGLTGASLLGDGAGARGERAAAGGAARTAGPPGLDGGRRSNSNDGGSIDGGASCTASSSRVMGTSPAASASAAGGSSTKSWSADSICLVISASLGGFTADANASCTRTSRLRGSGAGSRGRGMACLTSPTLATAVGRGAVAAIGVGETKRRKAEDRLCGLGRLARGSRRRGGRLLDRGRPDGWRRQQVARATLRLRDLLCHRRLRLGERRGLHGGPLGDDLVGVDPRRDLLLEVLLDASHDERHARRAADEKHALDVEAVEADGLDAEAAGVDGAVDEGRRRGPRAACVRARRPPGRTPHPPRARRRSSRWWPLRAPTGRASAARRGRAARPGWSGRCARRSGTSSGRSCSSRWRSPGRCRRRRATCRRPSTAPRRPRPTARGA